MTEQLPCDPGVLARIEAKLETKTARQVLDLFLDDAPRRIDRVLAGERSDDLQAAAAALHSIAGSASMLGANRLAEISRRMEVLARENDRDSFAAMLQQLDSAFAEAQAFLRERRKELEG